jgi:hypothetical protein
MDDKEFKVVLGLWLLGAGLILPLGQALGVEGVFAWMLIAVVFAPLVVLLVHRRLSVPDWLVRAAAYLAVAMGGIGVLAALALVGASAVGWIGSR